MLFFAQYYGAKDDDGIDRSYGITLAFMMTVAAVFASLALLAPEFVMKVYTDKTSIQAIGVKYLRIVGMAYPLQILSMAMSALLRSTDRVRIPFYASVASVGTNMLLNWVFIYGNLGLPSMGVQGAALATVCAALVNVLVIVVLAKLQKYPYLFHFTKHFRWKKEHIKAYLVKCFPIICNEVLIGVANMLINMVLGRQPEEAIAATAVFRTLEGLFIGFFAGVSNASSVLVGTCVGAGELDTAYELAKRMVLLCGSVIACCCLLLPDAAGTAQACADRYEPFGREFPHWLWHAVRLLCGGHHPHVQLDAERHLSLRRRRHRHRAGDQLYVPDGAAHVVHHGVCGKSPLPRHLCLLLY